MTPRCQRCLKVLTREDVPLLSLMNGQPIHLYPCKPPRETEDERILKIAVDEFFHLLQEVSRERTEENVVKLLMAAQFLKSLNFQPAIISRHSVQATREVPIANL